ncbi:protein kinase [bacterium]
MIGKTISHYKILDKLGEGGMGVVYKARDTKLDRTVALKFLPPHLTKKETDLARFIQEAKAAAALNHPNVCTIHEIHDEGENPFIVMEYVEGLSLRERIKDEGLRIKEVIEYAIQIGEALKAAHKKGVVHRDVKSENIMVTETGQVKVMDFGLAKLRGSVKLTKSSSTVGTMAYMSPEHLQGKDVDRRTDIFSFGVVLYEMLAGRLPFKGEYDSAMMYSIINEEPEPIQKYRSDLSSELLHVLNRAMEKDPEERYQSVNEMLIDLKRIQKHTDRVSQKSLNEMPDVEKTRVVKKSRLRFWIGMSSVMVLLMIVFWVISQKLFHKVPDAALIRQNTVAVMYFENLTDDSDLDIMQKSIVNLLITNLSRYEELGVVSSQRLFDLLKSVGKENDRTISKTTATKIARQANVQYMITGSILKAGDIIRVTSEISDIATGRNLGSDQTDGSGEEDTFMMVDNMTEKLVTLLGVTDSQIASQRISIVDVTTSNLEAYKYYQAGMDKKFRFDHSGAYQEFQQAVLLDSTFAMGYAWMAITRGVFQIQNPFYNMHGVREIVQRAKQYSFHTTEKERQWIQSIEALFLRDFETYEEIIGSYTNRYPEDKMGWYHSAVFLHNLLNDDRAFGYLEKTLELDPAFPDAYNILAYIHVRKGEYDTAISMAKRYMVLLPNEYNSYDTAHDIYLTAGKVDEAINVCERALRINESWLEFLGRIGISRLFQDRPEDARSMFEQLMQKDPDRAGNGYTYLGISYVHEGRFVEAVSQFQRALDWYRKQEDQLSIIMRGLNLAKVNMAMGQFQEAETVLSEIGQVSEEYYKLSFNPALLLIEYLRGRGWIQRGNAGQVQSAVDKIVRLIREQSMDDYYRGFYHLLLAEWHVKQGDPSQGSFHFRQIPGPIQVNHPVAYRIQSDLHALNKEYDEAIYKYIMLSKNIESRDYNWGGDFFDFFLERARVPYSLGMLYEAKGNKEKAIEYYEHAVERWKHADPGMEELEDARIRLAKLKERE